MDSLKRKTPEAIDVDSDSERKRRKLERKEEKKRRKAQEKEDSGVQTEDVAEAEVQKSDKKEKKKKRKRRDSGVDVETEDTVEETPAKHATIFKKLSKVKSRLEKVRAEQPQDEETTVNPLQPFNEPSQPLAPLPQPEVVTKRKGISALSALPSYLAEPETVPSTRKAPFSQLGVSEKLQQRLEKKGYSQAFAVQTAMIPLLLRKPFAHEDLLISAATGSGKTLGYAVPIVQNLSSRTYVCLRALVVVPTRELVSQVRETFEMVSGGTGLHVGVALGGRPLETERKLLLRDEWEDYQDPDDPLFPEANRWTSAVDILITTPGRLVEHIQTTEGFNLDNLEWLVIDEADRLMGQSFQEWLGVINGALKGNFINEDPFSIQLGELKINLSAYGLRNNPELSQQRTLRKIILSATMTRDIGQISELRLRRPRLIVVEERAPRAKLSLKEKKLKEKEEREAAEAAGDESEIEELFAVPVTLREHGIPVKDLSDKPLYLLNLLHSQEGMSQGVLVFTRTNENAARLWRLLQIAFGDSEAKLKRSVGLATKSMDKSARKKMLKQFRNEELDILICSDLMSRGMDLPAVRHVVNYDIPTSLGTYVHRVGRTARAGNTGDAWTLYVDKEGRYFWKEIGVKIKRPAGPIEKMNIDVEGDWKLRALYERSLEKLGSEVRGGDETGKD